jgi:hypothetical protein
MTEPMDTSRKGSGVVRLRGLPVFGFAAAGLLLGHALSYMLAVPDPYHRDVLLTRTGHGYLPAASQVAVVLALAAVAAILARAWASRNRGEPERFSSIAIRLAFVQTGAFAAQEILERVVAGAPLGDLMRDHLLVIGVAVQVVASLVGAAVLVWLASTSGRIAHAATGRPIALPGPTLVEALSSTRDHARGRIVASARNVRAPPSMTSP